jgi:hypothetical protein
MNPHNVKARRFALKSEKKQHASRCDATCGPTFWMCDILVSDNCCASRRSSTYDFGDAYIKDTGLEGRKEGLSSLA